MGELGRVRPDPDRTRLVGYADAVSRTTRHGDLRPAPACADWAACLDERRSDPHLGRLVERLKDAQAIGRESLFGVTSVGSLSTNPK